MNSRRIILLHNHDNTWTPEDLLEVAEDNRLAMAALRSHGYEVIDLKVHDSVARVMQAANCHPRDWLVFNWCEGYADRPWDYGGVAEELEHLRFAFTGASSWTLRLSQDKRLLRAVMLEAGVPLPLGVVARKSTGLTWENFPAIVKPTNQHGSYGIDRNAVVFDERELQARVAYVLETFDAPALVEEYIEGRELAVTVWGNQQPTMLPAVEIVYGQYDNPRAQVFSYDLKFDVTELARQNVGFICPPMLTTIARRRIQSACVQAFRTLRGRDYMRFDVRLRGDQPYIIDVNPNPDINSESMVQMSAEAAGMSYDDLVGQIANFAHERWLKQRQFDRLAPRPRLPVKVTS